MDDSHPQWITFQGAGQLKGRTPAQALREALGIDDLPSLDFTVEKEGSEAELPPAA